MPTNTAREIRLNHSHDSYQVIVGNYVAAEIAYRVHVGWSNGEPTYVETMPVNVAAEIAAQVAHTLNDEFNA